MLGGFYAVLYSIYFEDTSTHVAITLPLFFRVIE